MSVEYYKSLLDRENISDAENRYSPPMALRDISYNPPYRVSEWREARLFIIYTTERAERLMNAMFEKDIDLIGDIMLEYAPHILSFYERDVGPVDPVIMKLLENNCESLLDFQTIFSWIIVEEIEKYHSADSRQTSVYHISTTGEPWKRTCAEMIRIINERG